MREMRADLPRKIDLIRTVEPDTSVDELLRKIRAALAVSPVTTSRQNHDVDMMIMDAVVRCSLFSWGRKDGASETEMIPQLAWEVGRFEHREGKLVYRYPDSQFPEEYTDIQFNSGQLEPWLQQLGGRAAV